MPSAHPCHTPAACPQNRAQVNLVKFLTKKRLSRGNFLQLSAYDAKISQQKRFMMRKNHHHRFIQNPFTQHKENP